MLKDKKTLKRLLLVVGFGVLLNWVLNHLDIAGGLLGTVWGLIFPFFLGFVIAFILSIPMRGIENKLFRGRGGKLRRPASLVLSILLVLAIAAFVIFMVVPELVKTIATLVSAMPGYVATLEKELEPYLSYIPQVQDFIKGLNINWYDIGTKALGILQSGAGNFLNSAISFAGSVVSGVSSLFIGVIFACYLLYDKEHLTAQFKGLLQAYLPEKRYNTLSEVGTLANRTFSKFVAGQCTEAVAVGLVFLVVLSIGQFKYSLLLSVLIGFGSLIPVVGSMVACVVGAILILITSGFWRTVAFLIIFMVVQQLDGNFLYPRIVGNSVGLPAVWVLVAVTVGGGLFGIVGMLFFIPFFSVIYTLVHRNARVRLKDKGIESPVAQWQRENPPKPKRKGRRGGGPGGPPGTPPPSSSRAAGPAGDGTEAVAFDPNASQPTKGLPPE